MRFKHKMHQGSLSSLQSRSSSSSTFLQPVNIFTIFTTTSRNIFVVFIIVGTVLIRVTESSSQILHLISSSQSHNQKLSKGNYFDGGLPSSFAILINFGLDGQPRNMYSSHSHNSVCERKQQIWDPFSRQCRALFCKDHFELKDLKCVMDEESNDFKPNQKQKVKNSTEEDTKTKPYLKFLDSKSTFVNVTLDMTTNLKISSSYLTSEASTFASQFSIQFSAAWTINSTRVVNVSVAYVTGHSATVNFLIKEDINGIKNDDILALLSQEVVTHKQRYFVLERTWMAVAIHTTLSEMTDFCLKTEEMPIWYWNSEFTIVATEGSNITKIYVNSTGRIYYPGEYMATVLAVEDLDSNGRYRMNVSSNAVVCEQTLIDQNCPRILLNRSEYEFVHGRKLFSIAGRQYFEKYEMTDNQSIYVCLKEGSQHRGKIPNSPVYLDALDRKIESILSTTLMIVSLCLLTATLVTFIRLKSLRSTVNGYNSIHLVACLAVMQATFLGNQYIPRCRLPAAAFHYTILTTISWSSVIAFDMHQLFVRGSLKGRANTARVRILYSTVAYLLPLLIVAIANLGDLLNVEAIRGDYGPVLPTNVCWMRRKTATIIYFIAPITLTVLVNFALYVRIIIHIRSDIASFSTLKKVTRIPSNSSTSSTISVISSCEGGEGGSSISNRLNLQQTTIFLRLSVPLGFTWIIALFSTVVPAEYHLLLRIMAYLFIVANTSQGVTLFLAFGIFRKIFARE